ADPYASRCQGLTPERGKWPQGTALWGTKQAWNPKRKSDERNSVLVSINSAPLRFATGVESVRPEGGRLVAVPSASASLVGAVLQGTGSNGKPVDVAICGAEPAHDDPELIWYRIQAWNPETKEWENPCLDDELVQDPRALAVQGVWDASGARKDTPGKLTLACENGAITKCIRWGYKPWAQRDGKSLTDLHQACTRMARADYCGNGRSHTREHTIIDMYDELGVSSRTTEASATWDPAKASFEAAWAPDGATCLARTRDGRELTSILRECPDRFRTTGAVELGEGDRCNAQRKGSNSRSVFLRNRSYASEQSPLEQAQ
ncbi:ADYC domain-containing protein, partial [Corallococcus exercitus]|uniref:ADYC domain-containing protein n=1 Tax=Corallococcus exercitus TaxID=2316736 RepID=UPI001C0FB0E1